MFGSYTHSGEHVDDVDDTPQKRMIDELMGRTANQLQQQAQPVVMKDELEKIKTASASNMHRDGANGHVSSAREEKILVSNAQSRAVMDSLVSVGSGFRNNQPKHLTLQSISEYQNARLPEAPVNRFERQALELTARHAKEKKESQRVIELQNERLLRVAKPKYFKPGELFHNATNYTRVPLQL